MEQVAGLAGCRCEMREEGAEGLRGEGVEGESLERAEVVCECGVEGGQSGELLQH